jgi:hypothetical protein
MAEPITIVYLSKMAGELARAMSKDAELPFVTPVQFALGSGLDVALTLMEESVGTFRGLTQPSATGIVSYFRAEAARSRSVDPQIAIWYEAWASTIETHFIDQSSQ